jgi:hypothetical protein
VAIGAPNNDGSGNDSGSVRVYTYSNSYGTWSKLGEDIDGVAADDLFGGSVSIASDGRTVAVGAQYNDGSGNNCGSVRVFSYSDGSGTWLQKGNEIYGDYADIQMGMVSLSADGNTLIHGQSENYNLVKIYAYSSGSWIQKGSNILNSASSFGRSVSLSADGNTALIGAMANNGFGSVFVYSYSDSSWSQLGQQINGIVSSGFFGWSVSISADGRIIAIGSTQPSGSNNGIAVVYSYSVGTGTWIQIGQNITGEAVDDYFGCSVSLSANGSVLAVGAYFNDGSGNNSGSARVFSYSSDSWIKIGQDIDGEEVDDRFGSSISLSADGRIVSIGAPNNSSNKGKVRVYALPDTANPVTLGLKAPLASPTLTGVPTAPTAAVGTSTGQLATTAFVSAAKANFVQTATSAPTGTTGAMYFNTSDSKLYVYTGSVWKSVLLT